MATDPDDTDREPPWLFGVGSIAANCAEGVVVDGERRQDVIRFGPAPAGGYVVEIRVGDDHCRRILASTVAVVWDHPGPCQTCLFARRFSGL